MPEAANSKEIHLGIGPRHLWNVWPKTTQKGLYEIYYLKYKKIKNGMSSTCLYGLSGHFDVVTLIEFHQVNN
jgi:hypothetical protein